MSNATTRRYAVASIGFLDGAADAEDGGVEIRGWCVGEADDPVPRDVRLAIDGQPVDARAVVGESSPEVRDLHASLAGSERARFRVPVPPDVVAGLAGKRDLLLEAVPRFAHGDGRTLYRGGLPSLPTPPAENLQAVGGPLEIGFEFLGHLVNEAGLRRDARVLDVGCGTGRVALALSHYLRPPGRYVGFDVVEELVSWPQRHVAPVHPHFEFLHFDLSNGLYNRAGSDDAASVRFPAADASIDAMLLSSVLTHLTEPAIRHYFAEMRRTLAPGGRCLATCFVLDDDVLARIAAGASELAMRPHGDDAFTTDPDCPEVAIGFHRALFESWIRDAGLRIEHFEPGSWSGAARYLTYQDAYVLAPA